MKTILIPTDFSLESIKLIDSLVQNQSSETFRIIFSHAFKLSDSITDMLMLSRRSRDYENVSDEFYQKLNYYKAKYPKHLESVRIEYFYGSTTAAFRNFIDALEVDCIAYAGNYNFTPINKYSIDPKYLTERSGCETIMLNILTVHQPENLIDTKIPEVQLQESNA
jgi:ABC-type sulfate transport system substrate-binding protein